MDPRWRARIPSRRGRKARALDGDRFALATQLLFSDNVGRAILKVPVTDSPPSHELMVHTWMVCEPGLTGTPKRVKGT